MLLSHAGMSKRTMYAYFRSKEELIVAVLQYLHDKKLSKLTVGDDWEAVHAEAALTGMYDAARVWFSRPDFFGCIFINAVGEYAVSHPDIRQASIDCKASIRTYIGALCQRLGVADPEELADGLALLLEGAIVTAQVQGRPHAADTARRMARILIKDARAVRSPRAVAAREPS
jgi:AcrR family transcriptional regulator